MNQLITGLTNFFTTLILSIGVAILIILAALTAKFALAKFIFRKRLEDALYRKDNVFLQVKIPPSSENKEDSMVAFLHSLHRVLPSGAIISFEMVSNEQFLSFYLVTKRGYKQEVISQLYAQYADAEVEEAQDYFSHWKGNMSFMELGFKHSSTNPLRIYNDLEEDLLKNLSSVLSQTKSGEKVILQLVLKRIGSKSLDRGIFNLLSKLLGSTTTSPAQIKLSSDLFYGKLRLAYIAVDTQTATAKLSTIGRLLKVVKGPQNELVKKRLLFPASPAAAFQARIFEKGDLWSLSEIATIYHFPYKGNIVSNVVQTNSKRAPAPDILPREEVSDPKTISVIGETNYRNERIRFGMQRIDRRRHSYVIGKTGVGKSRLLELLMISDIKNGSGLCLLDPHGDLAEAVLLQIPKNRVSDVIYINPSDRDFPLAFNPLEYTQNYEKRQHIAFFFISIFKKIFAADWNERMEHILRYIILALLESPDSNVLGIPRILSDTKFRHRVISQLQDPVVKTFWANEFSSWNEQYSSQAIVPILNKVGQFISNPIIRNMVGQQKNTLDFEEFMNKGKIVIINVSKGKLGEENAALLGSMFITKIQQAALSRANIPEEERKDFYFYIDEFQNFATEAFKSILSESRKYRLNLTIAHQYVDQLTEDIKSSVFGNVASLFVFSIGGADAAYLEKEFSPVFTADDIINLEAREMYIKMSINGRIAKPFSARTVDTPKPQFNYMPDITSNTHVKYTTNRVAVERSIEKWSKATESTLEKAASSTDDYPEPIF